MQYTPASQTKAAVRRAGLSGRAKLAIVGLLLLGAFAYFGYTAFQSATSYYLTVDELLERGPTAFGEPIQVKGRLVSDSFSRALPDGSGPGTTATFLLEENGQQISATIEGAVPDLFFNPHSEIVLGGVYGHDGVFVADRVLVKCPSKYQSLEGEQPDDYGETPQA